MSDRFSGEITRRTIDLAGERRPSVPNPEGGYSTIFSESAGEMDPLTKKLVEVLYPRVVGGQILNSDAAWAQYKRTGRHLGKYADVPSAEAAGRAIHLSEQVPPEVARLLSSLRF